MMTERIAPRLEVHDDQQVDQHDRAEQAEQQPENALSSCAPARAGDLRALADCFARCRR
jgi:hypothetical protein